MRRLEPLLRGWLVGLGLYLAATGLATLPHAEASLRIQRCQVAHYWAGLLAILVGGAYLAVHGADVLARQRLPKRATWKRALAWTALTALALAVLSAKLTPRVRQLTNVFFVVTALGFCAYLVRLGVRLLRRGEPLTPFVMGLLAMLTMLLVGGTGALIPAGPRWVPYTNYDTAWVIHVASVPLLALAVGLHLVRAHARVRAAARRGSESPPYPWRGPLLRGAIPAVVVAGLATSYALWDPAPAPRGPLVGLVPVNAGFTELSARGCDICHEAVISDWRGSSHARAADNPFFTSLIGRFYEADRRETARFCIRCHAPHAPDPTQVDLATLVQSEGFRTGVQCLSCHRSVPTAGHGDGALSVVPLSAEHPLLLESETMRGIDGKHAVLLKMLVSARLPDHVRQFRHAAPAPESCLPCHVQTLTEPTQGRLQTVVQDQYDSWRRSPAAADGRDCKACHMPIYSSPDVYEVRDHRFIAASSYVAMEAGGAEAVALVELRLRGGTPRPAAELPELRPRASDPVPLLEMEAELLEADSGWSLRIRTRNSGQIGHSFPNGPTDLMQIWLALRAVAGDGRVLVDVGRDEPGGAPRLGHAFFDGAGQPIRDHRLWAVERVVDLGHVPESGWHTVELPLGTEPVVLPVTLDAAWNYRRLDPAVVRDVTGMDATGGLPIMRVAELRQRIVGSSKAGAEGSVAVQGSNG